MSEIQNTERVLDEPDDRRRGSRRQFGLKALFLLIALVGLCCMTWRWCNRRLAVFHFLKGGSWKLEHRDGMWFLHGSTGLRDGSLDPILNIDYVDSLRLPSDCCSASELRRLRHLPRLRELLLDSWRNMSDEHFEVIGGLPQLESVGLGSTEITATRMQQLSKLPQLRKLDLQGADITPDAYAWLGQCQALEELQLDGTPRLSSANLTWLRYHPKLQSLSMSGPPNSRVLYDPETFKILADMPALKYCCMIQGGLSAFPDRAYRRLRAARPDLVLELDNDAHFFDEVSLPSGNR
jgi:hypothetical protein